MTASVSYRVPDTTRDLTLTGSLNLFAVGTSGLDTLRGNDGANFFEAVNDTLGDTISGGKGDDVYRVDTLSENVVSGAASAAAIATVVTELAGEGGDTLESAYWSAQLPANVENLQALAPNNVNSLAIDFWHENDLAHRFIGNALDNRIDASVYEETSSSQWWYARRNAGGLSSVATFRLDGGAGADTLIGGLGDDTYVVDSAADSVIELGLLKGGQDVSNDTVETPFETALANQYAHIENVTLIGIAAVGASGTAVANRLDGSKNSAANRLAGGAGDDTYVVGVGDVVVEQPGEGVDALLVAASAASLVRLADYPNVENLRLLATAGALDAEGDAAANILNGNAGNNRLDGGGGNDTLTDQYLGDITMYGGRVASGDSDVLDGGAGNDVLTTYGGNDTLDGGAGDDRLVVNGLIGQNGTIAASTVTVRFGFGDGADEVQRFSTPLNRYVVELKGGCSLADVSLSARGDALLLTLSDGSSLEFAQALDPSDPLALNPFFTLSMAFADGMRLDTPQLQTMLRTPDRTTATALGDLLIGTGGNDVIAALGGDDFAFAMNGDDLVDGGAGNDSLFGGAGADTLTGGGGNDLLAGGSGADVYRLGRGFGLDVIDDRLVSAESAGVDDGAFDAVEFDATVLPSDVAVYRQSVGIGTAGLVLALTATGDRVELRNTAMPGVGGAVEAVRFADGTQWDVAAMVARVAGVVGTLGDDTLIAPVIGSTLLGMAGNDTLTGSAGADVLDGGSGNDTMSGLAGDDTYQVDTSFDQVIEAASAGNDTIVSTVDNLTLPANVERLQLGGSASLRGTGNALNNVLIGNSGNNRLDGSTGADAMSGGVGDDVYVVDSTGDTIVEAPGEGVDTVEASITYSLGANVENLLLTGTSRLNGTGNALDNVLNGNSAANTLIGGDGNDRLNGGGAADSMTGGNGNDTYVVDTANDKTIETAGGGIDTVESTLAWTLSVEVERLVLLGSAAVNGTGNASNNALVGNDAANVLDGKAGADILLGLAGSDTLQDTAGNGAFDGGAGADILRGGTGADLLAGGVGNDTLTLGGGTDIICFDRGDGADLITAPLAGAGSGERNDTISLGGIAFAQLALNREGSDLLLKQSGGVDSLRFKDWYLSGANQTVNRLQIVVDTTADYAPGSSDVLRNSRLCVLDFDGLVTAFDAAKAANPVLGDWTPAEALLVASRVSSSDSVTIGGALAYRYAEDRTLANVDYTTAIAQLTSAGFGSAPQTQAPGGAADVQAPAELAPAVETAVASELAPAIAPEALAQDGIAPATNAATSTSTATGIWTGTGTEIDLVSIGAGDAAPGGVDSLGFASADIDIDAGLGTSPRIGTLTGNVAMSAGDGAARSANVALNIDESQAGADSGLDTVSVSDSLAAPIRLTGAIGAEFDTPPAMSAANRQAPIFGTPSAVDVSTLVEASGLTLPDAAAPVVAALAASAAPKLASPPASPRAETIDGAGSNRSAESLAAPTGAPLAGSAESASSPAPLAETDPGIRSVDQIAADWFGAEAPLQQGIALSHFVQVVRNELTTDGAGAGDSADQSSYAAQWQRMHRRLEGFALSGTDDHFVDSTSTDLRSDAAYGTTDDGRSPFAPIADIGPLIRNPLPLFSGLQDGLARL
ncbi:MAG: calcium-binding protein [Caldimonas sp.]